MEQVQADSADSSLELAAGSLLEAVVQQLAAQEVSAGTDSVVPELEELDSMADQHVVAGRVADP